MTGDAIQTSGDTGLIDPPLLQVDTVVKRFGGFTAVDRLSLDGRAADCQATTLPHVDNARQVHLPMHVYISARFAPELPATQACLALTLTHEIGHTLGIFRHSPRPEDLMYGNPTVTGPSERDRNTAEILYHTPANVVPVRGP